MELHIRKIQVQGGSHNVNLPKAVLTALDVKKGDFFCYNVFPGGMVQVSKFEPDKYQREIALETMGDLSDAITGAIEEGDTQDQKGEENGTG